MVSNLFHSKLKLDLKSVQHFDIPYSEEFTSPNLHEQKLHHTVQHKVEFRSLHP